MRHYATLPMALALTALVAGCGGSSGGGTAPVVVLPPSFADMDTAATTAATGIIDLTTGTILATDHGADHRDLGGIGIDIADLLGELTFGIV